MPSTAPGRMVRDVLAAGETASASFMSSLGGGGGLGSDRSLIALYDLDVMPPTFDVASFLFLAEQERRRSGCSAIHLVVIPGRNLEPQNAAEAAVPDSMRQMRVNSIVIPVSRLLASCAGLTLCATRADASRLRFAEGAVVFPAKATPTFPVAPDQSLINREPLSNADAFPLFRAPEPELQAVSTWLGDRIGQKRPVVISLRESRFMPARNSDVGEWIAFADQLAGTDYAPVFVRDTERALERPSGGLERFPVFEAASWNVALRMALYETAFVNLAVMHGAMELCWFNDRCRYAAFMPVGTSPQTSPEFLGSRGFAEGRSLPFAGPDQKLVWQPQNRDEIRAAFDTFLAPGDGLPARTTP
ncbi:MAG: hypothetical protein AAGF59_01065 [Pseudomonadota bacterium]